MPSLSEQLSHSEDAKSCNNSENAQAYQQVALTETDHAITESIYHVEDGIKLCDGLECWREDVHTVEYSSKKGEWGDDKAEEDVELIPVISP